MNSLSAVFHHCFTLIAVVSLALVSPAYAVESKRLFINTETDKRFVLTKEFDIKSISAKLGKTNTARLHFNNKEKVQIWTDRARKELKNLLGVSNKKTNLDPVTKDDGKFVIENNEGQQFTYTRQEVQYISRDGFPIFGYVILPEKAKGKLPCIICIAGHSRSVDDIVGINIDGTTRKKLSIDYQYDYALQCMSKGFAVLAIEALGSGRLQNKNLRQRDDNQSLSKQCRQLSSLAIAHGKTLLGWNVNSVISGIDYLQTRKEIAPDRIGILGCSRGATVSLFSAAVEPRIKCAVVSCYLCDWQPSILSIDHCICNYIPNVLSYFKMSDIAGLVAPRYLFCENNKNDIIFPYKGTLEALSQARQIFKAYGCEDHIFLSTGQANHTFRGTECLAKMKQFL